MSLNRNQYAKSLISSLKDIKAGKIKTTKIDLSKISVKEAIKLVN